MRTALANATSPLVSEVKPARPGPVGLVDRARLPLAFIGFGLVSLVAASFWLALETSRGVPFLFHPRIIGLAHLWLPGFLLSVCLGASYQLLPVLLGSPLSEAGTWRWIHLCLHGAGVTSLVSGLATGHYVAAAAGGSAIAIGSTGLLVVTLRAFRSSRRRDVVAWCLPLSSAWLAATTTSGVLLAANRHHPFFPGSILDLLKAHAHLGLAGYFLTLLQGVSFQLIPMFTLGKCARPDRVAQGLAGGQIGLALLVPGLAWDLPALKLAGSALVLFGLMLSGHALGQTLATRGRQPLDASLRGFLAGLALLAGAAGIGIALLLPRAGVGSGPAVAYGLLLVAGGLTCTILGMLGRILPFLVWMKRYGPQVGRGPVPLGTQLAPPGLESAWWRIHLVAIVLLSASATLGSEVGFSASGGLLLLAVGIWVVHAGRILRNLIPTPDPTPVPLRAERPHASR